jgi:hypothetical protein
MVHSWVETGEIPKGRPGLTLKKKIEATGIQREELWAHGLHEVPLAYNVNTGEARALVLPVPTEEKNKWKSEFGGEWITGTADYVGVLLELPWVDDLKTGRKVVYGSYRYQQAFYSLVWTLFQMRELTPARSTITHWPKYPINLKPERFGTLLEPEFFLDFQGKLKSLYQGVARLKEKQEQGMTISGYLNEGEQCTYCPSKLNCERGLNYGRE